MDAQPTRSRLPLATVLALLGLLTAPAGLRADLLVGAPAGEAPSPGVRPWAPAPASAARSRREPAASPARPLLALVMALAIPPTFLAHDVVSSSGTSPRLDKVPTPTPGGNSNGPPTLTPNGGGPPAQTTPEPASLVSCLVGVAVAGAAALSRRRRALRQTAATA
jgi:hypothetical protein